MIPQFLYLLKTFLSTSISNKDSIFDYGLTAPLCPKAPLALFHFSHCQACPKARPRYPFAFSPGQNTAPQVSGSCSTGNSLFWFCL